jgi:hypothetical protein
MTENKRILKVLQGFIELNSSERNILVSELSEFTNKSSSGKDDTKREVSTKLISALGPTSDNSCPCCGKS